LGAVPTTHLLPSTCLLSIVVLSYYYYSRNKGDVEGSHNANKGFIELLYINAQVK
jgi:hypothetical protein